MNNQTVRTTITLPAELLAATDKAVSQGKAKSRNEFVAQALLHELEALKRAECGYYPKLAYCVCEECLVMK